MDVSEDIVTRNYSGMKFDEVLEYLIQEVKARNYLITRINNIDNIHAVSYTHLTLPTNREV